MILEVAKNNFVIDAEFGELYQVSDGGHDDAYEAGIEVGYNKGYSEGRDKGYNEGYKQGDSDGYKKGEFDGWQNGYDNGYTQAKSEIEEVTITPALDAQEILPTEPNLISKVNVKSGKPLYDAGKADGYDEGYTAGAKIAESKPYINTKEISNFSYFCQQDRFTFEELELLDTSNGTDFTRMFYDCESLTTIPSLDFSGGTIFNSMFRDNTGLTTIPSLDFSGGTNFNYMFQNCTSLTTIPTLDLSSGTECSSMFRGCTNLTTIQSLDLGNGTNFAYLFYGCKNLTTIQSLNISSGTNLGSMFQDCTNLQHITIVGNIQVSLDIRYSTLLTHDSLMSIINALTKSPASGTTLTIGSTNIKKLSAAELATIQSKGWKYA